MGEIRLTFKTPDAVSDAAREFVERELAEMCPCEERDELREEMVADVERRLSRWFRHGEYVTVTVHLTHDPVYDTAKVDRA